VVALVVVVEMGNCNAQTSFQNVATELKKLTEVFTD